MQVEHLDLDRVVDHAMKRSRGADSMTWTPAARRELAVVVSHIRVVAAYAWVLTRGANAGGVLSPPWQDVPAGRRMT
jgi:hypothetical protein